MPLCNVFPVQELGPSKKLHVSGTPTANRSNNRAIIRKEKCQTTIVSCVKCSVMYVTTTAWIVNYLGPNEKPILGGILNQSCWCQQWEITRILSRFEASQCEVLRKSCAIVTSVMMFSTRSTSVPLMRWCCKKKRSKNGGSRLSVVKNVGSLSNLCPWMISRSHSILDQDRPQLMTICASMFLIDELQLDTEMSEDGLGKLVMVGLFAPAIVTMDRTVPFYNSKKPSGKALAISVHLRLVMSSVPTRTLTTTVLFTY